MTVPNREVFRLAPPLIFWWVWLAFAVANVADFALQGAPTRLAIVVSAILVTITGLAFTLALRPRVIAEPSGLTIVNPFRAHHVPWAAITAVDTGEWVQVHYAPGAAADKPASSASGRAISCWALYISARTKRRAAKLARAGPLGAASFDRANLPAARARGHATRRTPGCPRRRSTSPRCRPLRPSPFAWTPEQPANAPAPGRIERTLSRPGGHGRRSRRWPCPPSPC